MDSLIKRFDSEKDEDLVIVAHRGLAYQRNMGKPKISYDAKYLAHYEAFAGSTIERELNAGRVALLSRHAALNCSVLDVGVGSGAFVRAAKMAGFEAKGFDVNPAAVEKLKSEELFSEDLSAFDAVTFWDSLEHIEELGEALRKVRGGAIVAVAVPIIQDLNRIRESKHYKPGEHLYYWTERGFIDLMAVYGFRLLECSPHETDSGRESIGAFAFKRDLPGYRDHIAAYSEMHNSRHYGSSATGLYLQHAMNIVRQLRPNSILDFGCGRSDLASHFYLDGARRIERYDPALPALRELPGGSFDLVFCCDVLEHIPMLYVDKVLHQVRSKSARAFFSISTKLARAKLPDGRNAHVTLLTKMEWTRWVGSYFGQVSIIPASLEHELVIVGGAEIVGAKLRKVA